MLSTREKERYANQPKGSILDQLRKNGYVDGQLLSDTDITQILTAYLGAQNIPFIDPISITDDNGRALSDALKAKNMPGKLIIPANVGGNHWVLIVCTAIGDRVEIKCRDPETAPSLPKQNITKAIVENSARVAYPTGNINISYNYEGEQKDNYTCGVRIVRWAFQELGIDNILTRAPADNPNLLYAKFVELLAQTDPTLKDSSLEIQVGSDAPLVYSSNQTSPEMSTAIENKKTLQVKTDEYLAIALQEVYRTHSDALSEGEALRLAANLLKEKTNNELQQLKVDIVGWTKKHFQRQQPSANFQKNRPVVNVTDDGIEMNEFTSLLPGK